MVTQVQGVTREWDMRLWTLWRTQIEMPLAKWGYNVFTRGNYYTRGELEGFTYTLGSETHVQEWKKENGR